MKAWALTVGRKIVMNGCRDLNNNRIEQYCIYESYEEACVHASYGWDIREVEIKIKPKRRVK